MRPGPLFAMNGFGLIICSDTITIAPGSLYLPDDTLSYCLWNTINLADTLSTYYLQNGTNPEYIFSIGGTPIDGSSYYINNPGITTIDVLPSSSTVV